MSIVEKLSSQIGEKTEEANRQVTQECLQNPSLLKEISEGLLQKDAKLLGDCAEVMTMVAEVQPELVVPFAKQLIPLLSHKTTRVRWEAMHALALIAEHIPEQIIALLPQIDEILEVDKSTIVRDYAVEAICNLAKTGEKEAENAFPLLKKALLIWDGKHRARALKGFLHICQSTTKFTLEIRGIAEEYAEDKKGVVKKAVKTLIKAIETGTV